MVVIIFNPFKDAGMEPDKAWHTAMIVPGVMFLLTAIAMRLRCWDTPTAKRFITAETGKTQGASI
eukprot:11905497-Karenia_brevis.AAC.1